MAGIDFSKDGETGRDFAAEAKKRMAQLAAGRGTAFSRQGLQTGMEPPSGPGMEPPSGPGVEAPSGPGVEAPNGPDVEPPEPRAPHRVRDGKVEKEGTDPKEEKPVSPVARPGSAARSIRDRESLEGPEKSGVDDGLSL